MINEVHKIRPIRDAICSEHTRGRTEARSDLVNTIATGDRIAECVLPKVRSGVLLTLLETRSKPRPEVIYLTRITDTNIPSKREWTLTGSEIRLQTRRFGFVDMRLQFGWSAMFGSWEVISGDTKYRCHGRQQGVDDSTGDKDRVDGAREGG